MSDYEIKNGFGNIFKNIKKTEPKHPDYRGEFKTPSGELLQISLWVKDGNKGKFFSVSIQEPYKKPEVSEVKSEIPSVPEEFTDSDDLPF